MDNGTLVESFKFLNYFQLAKNSLASKRFRDVIRMHRHRLALLYIKSICMESWRFLEPAIRIFGKELSSEEYNEWIVRNEYSKQIPPECQVAEMESTEDDRKIYQLTGHYRVSPNLEQTMKVFDANAKLNPENWPLFQHFIRLLTDPFIYVHSMELPTRNDILHLLTEAMYPDRSRLQCDHLWLYLEGNAPKFISWTKDHVLSDTCFFDYSYSNKLNYNTELLDLFLTGANCSSKMILACDGFPKIVDDFVQKFLDLKACDEYQVVKSIEFDINDGSINEFKEKYAKFTVQEELSSDGITNYIFEFINDNIGKKLQITTFMLEEKLSCYVSNL